MQYVAGAAFLLAVYSDYLADSGQLLHCPRGSSGSQDLLSLAKSQVDYVLGSNPRGISYLVGHGGRHPRRVHHRAASSVSYKVDRSFVGCTQGFDEWYGRGGDNPNDVVGAVVGGPDDKDEFSDVRGNYVQTEACTYNTAPMVGVLAKLATDVDLAAKSSRPRTAGPLTWPTRRSWSTGCMKDASCRTADLAQVRSAPPTCKRTPPHQYGRHGERHDDMMVSHECGKVIRYERPTAPTIKAPAPPRSRGIAKKDH
ncbi:hypothetical protein B296_00019174 [Ensete ventricosum]|uniref:cellulase n=1 Tax=Ensete ventricosum TaxID=4639 RepID=A0A426ZGU7_ENSVE|nr:hypothetical protein B296_00019174 [Ensete ventricosum]